MVYYFEYGLAHWSYGSRVGMEFIYHLCDNSDKPYIANCTSKFTITRLMSNNSVLLMEGPMP
jgi:hypothetical protein